MRVLKYPVVIEKAERNYSAFCSDLLGCVATGKSIELTIKNMEAAIRMHLAGLRADGLPIPRPSATVSYKVNKREILTGVEILLKKESRSHA